MKTTFFLILTCVAFSLTAQNTTIEWRNDRTGVYNETGLLKSWPEAGPQLLWHYDDLGDGYSSVAIANEKIYVTGMTGAMLTLFVFDLNGKLLNKKEVGKEVVGGEGSRGASQYPGPRSTVVINDGKLYINNSLGTIICLNETTLNEIWKKDVLTDFDGKNVMWGMTESPLIVGEKIFITPGGEKNNMVALNKNTGALIWSSPGLSKVSAYCSPLYISDQSIPIVVTCFDKYIAAFNANTGVMLWSHEQPHGNTIQPNTPIYSNGMILSSTGYRGGTWLYRLKEGGKAADLVWHNSEMDNSIGGIVKVGDYVYASNHRSGAQSLFCIDWKTGETKYKEQSLGECNVISADGMLYVYTTRGTMNLVKPNPDKYELVSSFNITLGTNQHWAHPVIYKTPL
jgi:outer membrane protein assembly factor BamB